MIGICFIYISKFGIQAFLNCVQILWWRRYNKYASHFIYKLIMYCINPILTTL